MSIRTVEIQVYPDGRLQVAMSDNPEQCLLFVNPGNIITSGDIRNLLNNLARALENPGDFTEGQNPSTFQAIYMVFSQ